MPSKSKKSSRGKRPQGGSRRRHDFTANDRTAGNDDPEGALAVEGTITHVLAGTMFKVQLGNGHVVLAHISGKMRKRFIKLVIGDKVKMEMSPYDTTKARITFRL